MLKKLFLFILFLTLQLSYLFPVSVYIEGKAEIGKTTTLVIDASDYKGYAKGEANFGNSIIKWSCISLDHNKKIYNIIPTTNKAVVKLELDNGTKIEKIINISGNKSIGPFFLYYNEEKECTFENNTKNMSSINIKTNLNSTKNENKNNSIKIFLFIFSIIILIALFLSYFYFKNIRKIEDQIEKKERKLSNKIKKELKKIENEEDFKKKAFLLYKLLSDNNFFKRKEFIDKLYYLSFKKELSLDDKSFLEDLINRLKKGDDNE